MMFNSLRSDFTNAQWAQLAASTHDVVLDFVRRRGPQLSTFAFHMIPWCDSMDFIPSYSPNLLNHLLNVRMLSLSNTTALRVPTPPLKHLHTLYLGVRRMKHSPADVEKEVRLFIPPWALSSGRLLRVLKNLSYNPSIHSPGQPGRWTSTSCPHLQVIGELGVDWTHKAFHKFGTHISAAWPLKECQPDLIDKHGRTIDLNLGESDIIVNSHDDENYSWYHYSSLALFLSSCLPSTSVNQRSTTAFPRSLVRTDSLLPSTMIG